MPVNPVDVFHMSCWIRLLSTNKYIVLLYQLTWLVNVQSHSWLHIAGNRHRMPKKMVGIVLWWIMVGILKMSHPLPGFCEFLKTCTNKRFSYLKYKVMFFMNIKIRAVGYLCCFVLFP